MRPFEDAVASELVWLSRARVPARAVHVSVRELLVARLDRGPLGAREVSDAVEAAVRAACRLVREMTRPTRWSKRCASRRSTRCAATAARAPAGSRRRRAAAHAVLDELAQERAEEPSWRWIARRLGRG